VAALAENRSCCRVLLVPMFGRAPADAFVVPDKLKNAVSTATGAVPPVQDAPELKFVPELFHVMLAPLARGHMANHAKAMPRMARVGLAALSENLVRMSEPPSACRS
jgi:hypothetical protein